MMKTLFAFAVLCAGLSSYAVNLVQDGGFDKASANLYPECRSNGGRISLYTEDLNWNKCAKLEIDKIQKSPDGREKISAIIWIGGKNTDNKKPGGFACKPNTAYRFSFDLKGIGGTAGVSIYEWRKGQTLWGMKQIKNSLGPIKDVKTEWTNYKGSFRTGPDAVGAALVFALWGDSKYSPLRFKVGDYILIDNVLIEEDSSKSLTPNTETVQPLNIRKVIASGSAMNDFSVYLGKKLPSAATKVTLTANKTSMTIHAECFEPVKVTSASTPKLWSGDTLEFFCAVKNGARRYSQFSVGPGGETYTGNGGTPMELPWKATVSKSENSWIVDAEIPYSSIDTVSPQAGSAILFNVGRTRKAAKELQTWAPVKNGFGDVEQFGTLLLGEFPNGMTRPQYEKHQAEKSAAELNAKFNKKSNRTFLAAPVRITEDYSVPFLPDAVFDPPATIELKAAVNEIKPLALAILNKTDKAAEYRVTIDIPPPDAQKRSWKHGTPFPGLTLRRGVRVRDSKDANGVMFDPLPKLGEAFSIVVPPRESGLLWADFDTTNLKPGLLAGRLRIVPLNGKGGFRGSDYSGDMLEIPLTLEIRDIVLDIDPSLPLGLFSEPGNACSYRLMREAGTRWFSINTWAFHFPLENGEFVQELPLLDKALEKYDFRKGDRVSIVYNAYNVFLQLYKEKNAALWPKWVRAIAEYLAKHGVEPQNTRLEVFDEPDPKNFESIFKVFSEAKKMDTKMMLMCTLGAHIMSPGDMEKLSPYTDWWCLWSYGYFDRPEYLKFIDKVQKQGAKVSHYTCDTNLRSSTDRNYRRNAWFGEYHKLDGNDLFQGILLHDEKNWLEIPYGNVIYMEQDSAIPSIRYMALRQGMTDVKYLAKLREIGKDSPEAKKFLETAAKRVCVDFSHDPDMPDKVREEAAQLILKLQK